MTIHFSKYQGTGNDFVMLDNMNGQFDTVGIKEILFLCDRKMGIGADGLIKISAHNDFDFEVEYFNADGSQSFCGNGARCSVAYAKALNIIGSHANFLAIDGAHTASIENGIVRLEMLPVENIEEINQDYFLDTGSPHYVRVLGEKEELDIVEFGKQIRYSERYSFKGVNVNTIREIKKDKISVETYERGVEDETLSCGTGVTACALLIMHKNADVNQVQVKTKGGDLKVEAESDGKGFKNIWLSGPAIKVFDGSIGV